MHEMAHLFIFGLGYTSRCIATAAKSQGWTISATGSSGDVNFADEAGMMAQIAHADYILSSVPPADGGDPVLSSYGAALSGKRIGYLSSTGVYGDTGGAWVDEAAPIGIGRRTLRADCDAEWLARGGQIFRLPGIYGPGRYRQIDKAAGLARGEEALPRAQWTNRIHRDDCVGLLKQVADGWLAGQDMPPLVIGTDNVGGRNLDVLQWLAQQQGLTLAVPDDAPAGKRIRSQYIRQGHYTLRYPGYQDGYSQVLAEKERQVKR